MSKLVTVVTPTWKRPKTVIEYALPSVWNQTYRPIEHLIVEVGQSNAVGLGTIATVSPDNIPWIEPLVAVTLTQRVANYGDPLAWLEIGPGPLAARAVGGATMQPSEPVWFMKWLSPCKRNEFLPNISFAGSGTR